MPAGIPTVLSIAGSDSGGGAGIQADLKTFAALGVYGTTAITAVTAQNTQAVTAVAALDPTIVTAQIDAIASDIRVHAVKTGMLATTAIVEAIAAAVDRWSWPHVVVDPVMVATSGDRLLTPDAIDAMGRLMVPRATVLAPNKPEAEALARMPIDTMAHARDAARRLYGLGAKAIVIKGGHFTGPELVNLLYDGKDFIEFSTPRIETRNTHGTGCTFASAIAAHLARGLGLVAAVDGATSYVAGGIRNGLAIGRGAGPVDHFWRRSQAPDPGP
jgi:hydroxymethylpyrimidine/phosphomethylpyrimidine kinase